MSLALEPKAGRDALFLSPSKIVRLFVWSDVSTFLLQAAGGGISVNAKSANLGKDVSVCYLFGLGRGLMLMVDRACWTYSSVNFFCDVYVASFVVWLESVSRSYGCGRLLMCCRDTKYSQYWHPRGGRNMRVLFFTTCLTTIGLLVSVLRFQ